MGYRQTRYEVYAMICLGVAAFIGFLPVFEIEINAIIKKETLHRSFFDLTTAKYGITKPLMILTILLLIVSFTVLTLKNFRYRIATPVCAVLAMATGLIATSSLQDVFSEGLGSTLLSNELVKISVLPGLYVMFLFIGAFAVLSYLQIRSE